MLPASPSVRQTRVSRETRRLLAAAAVAFLLLSVLARIRFPDQATTPNPVAPVLTQLVPRRALADLAAELASLQRRLEPFVVAAGATTAGLRALPDTVATWVPEPAAHRSAGDLIAIDRATGLTLLLPPSDGPAFDGPRWAPENLAQPAFLVAASASAAGIVLTPVYVATLAVENSAVWSGPIWVPPPATAIAPGTLLFSTDAELAGLTITRGGAPAIVPAETLLGAVRRLRAAPAARNGWIGVDVQPLTTELAAAVASRTGAGLVVAWVEPDSPAAGMVRPGDVIDTVNGNPATAEEWQAVAGRLREGETMTLGIARIDGRATVTLTAGVPPARQAAPAPAVLGLTLRRVPAGAEIVDVEARSSADTAGLRAGDVIHFAGTTVAPTPVQVRAAFEADDAARPLLIGVTRGADRLVLSLPR
ncbi:MAG: PDZ domain-containing protein [Vicinamibacterales bacterium]